MWFVDKTRTLYKSMMSKHVNALISIQNLETDLILQKGITTYYYLSNDLKWLNILQEKDALFTNKLSNSRTIVSNEAVFFKLDELEALYSDYVSSRNDVIQLYHEGKTEKGEKAHWYLRDKFNLISDKCKQLKHIYVNKIRQDKETYKKSAHFIVLLAWCAIPIGIVLIILLTVILFKQIFGPIRALAIGYENKTDADRADEVLAVKHRVETLRENINEAKSELRESREQLIHSEKLAITGKLSAGVAHSVRNPLTSVKMRLFSLERSLELNLTQKEDFDVISEEIRHIDSIVQNFLEFSRPPKLELRLISPSDVVDAFLELLKHRIDLFQLDIQVSRVVRLPRIMIDPDQMKEALINLFMNACDAVGEGGQIKIIEEIVINKGKTSFVRISLQDNGPGIDIVGLDQIFQPFYTSKQEGTGLGLSITDRIISEHKGKLSFSSTLGKGTTVIIQLPVQETYNV